MFRDQLAAWATIAFAVVLVLLTVTDQGGPGASALLFIGAVLLVGLFIMVEQSLRRRAQGPRRMA